MGSDTLSHCQFLLMGRRQKPDKPENLPETIKHFASGSEVNEEMIRTLLSYLYLFDIYTASKATTDAVDHFSFIKRNWQEREIAHVDLFVAWKTTYNGMV